MEVTVSGQFVHKMDRTLAEILISNLLNNAVRHTNAGQEIRIDIGIARIVFSNPGPPLPVPYEKLFERFFKISANSRSLGIGLSLVKIISETYGLKVAYSYHDSMHHFSIEP